MKKIFLTALAFSVAIFAAEAQTKKKKSKKKPVSKEQKLNADISKIKRDKAAKFEEERLERMQEDSMRIADETREEFVKDSLRQDWKAKKLAEVDSTNNVNWTKTMADKDAWYNHDRSQTVINKRAGLNDIQGRKVKEINEDYNNRAKLVKENIELTDEQKKTQLVALNTERREEIQAVVGKKKTEKLEKERMNYSKKNSDDMDSRWINDAAVAKGKNK